MNQLRLAPVVLCLLVAWGVSTVSAQTVVLQKKMGQPIDGLSVGESQRFDAGKVQFNRVFTASEGLGPGFNQTSCASCHNNPVGGTGSIMVTRFGLFDPKGGGFDPLAYLGGSLLQSQSITMGCEELVPIIANVTANRVTTGMLGSGLIEAIPDADLQANASSPPGGVTGVTHMVPVLEDPTSPLRVGRFGWKAQLATLLSFSGDATLNEMGITNRLVPNEEAPNGNLALLASCDTVADPEDGPDAQGFDFIDRVTDFQRFLAQPPQTPRSGMAGEAIFNSIGCANCHVASFTTSNDPSLETFLRNKTIQPYSDFLLHDMGQAADFIEQGGAGMQELKTPPLWGVRVRDPLWHDGWVAGGTLYDRIAGSNGAIAEHDSFLSEGQPSAQAFAALSQADKDALVAFIDSLGRAEFDGNGDGTIDYLDLALFNQAMGNGPYNPDDPEAVHDVDQDGDVDNNDWTWFIQNFDVDCNANGTNDLVDILVNQTSFDSNNNLIPDECEHCQTDLGGGGPSGTLTMSVCGDPLTNTGSLATGLVAGAPPGNQLILVLSNNVNPMTIVGGGTLLAALPFTFITDQAYADGNGQYVLVVPGGGPPVSVVAQAATVVGTTIELSNAVQLDFGM